MADVKISELTGYDGDPLDGNEAIPITEVDEGQTEKIGVSQLLDNAPTVTGTDGNVTVAADSTNGQIDIENRTGTSKTVTLTIIG